MRRWPANVSDGSKSCTTPGGGRIDISVAQTGHPAIGQSRLFGRDWRNLRLGSTTAVQQAVGRRASLSNNIPSRRRNKTLTNGRSSTILFFRICWDRSYQKIAFPNFFARNPLKSHDTAKQKFGKACKILGGEAEFPRYFNDPVGGQLAANASRRVLARSLQIRKIASLLPLREKVAFASAKAG
jgi:hypothetical protein